VGKLKNHWINHFLFECADNQAFQVLQTYYNFSSSAGKNAQNWKLAKSNPPLLLLNNNGVRMMICVFLMPKRKIFKGGCHFKGTIFENFDIMPPGAFMSKPGS
jgi:hypothetical protein